MNQRVERPCHEFRHLGKLLTRELDTGLEVFVEERDLVGDNALECVVDVDSEVPLGVGLGFTARRFGGITQGWARRALPSLFRIRRTGLGRGSLRRFGRGGR